MKIRIKFLMCLNIPWNHTECIEIVDIGVPNLYKNYVLYFPSLWKQTFLFEWMGWDVLDGNSATCNCGPPDKHQTKPTFVFNFNPTYPLFKCCRARRIKWHVCTPTYYNHARAWLVYLLKKLWLYYNQHVCHFHS